MQSQFDQLCPSKHFYVQTAMVRGEIQSDNNNKKRKEREPVDR